MYTTPADWQNRCVTRAVARRCSAVRGSRARGETARMRRGGDDGEDAAAAARVSEVKSGRDFSPR